MKLTLKSPETAMLAVCTLLLLIALLGPSVGQPANYHQFADQHKWFGIPFAMDVLTNLPFAVWGIIGLLRLRELPRHRLDASQRGTAKLFFASLSNSLQRMHVDNVTSAKTPETRQRRIDKCLALFLAGKPR